MTLSLPDQPSTYDLLGFARSLEFVVEQAQEAGDEDWHLKLHDVLTQFFGEAVPQKVEGCYHVVKRYELEAKHLDNEAKRLSDKAAVKWRAAKRIKDLGEQLVVMHEELTGQPVKAGPRFEAKMVGKPPKVIANINANDLIDVRPDLVRVTLALNKISIAADLKAGRDVPGCRLDHGKRLRWG